MRVVVRVVDAPSRVQVQADGQTVLHQVIQPGFYREFQADRELSIRAEDAGAVQTESGGRDDGPLGARGENVIRTYTLRW